VPPYAKFYLSGSGKIASWRATTGAKVKFGWSGAVPTVFYLIVFLVSNLNSTFKHSSKRNGTAYGVLYEVQKPE